VRLHSASHVADTLKHRVRHRFKRRMRFAVVQRILHGLWLFGGDFPLCGRALKLRHL